jgi:putative transposase
MFGKPKQVEQKDAREMKGLAMAKGIGKQNEPDVCIQRLNKLTYKVKSQTDASKWYTVIKQYAKTFCDNIRDGQWTCDCPDHCFRNVVCKHIHAVLFSKLLRKKVYQDSLIQTPINQTIIEATELEKILCQRYGSENFKRDGIRHNKKNEELQRYKCRDCSHRFIVNPAFENAKASAKVITAALDMYFKGISLRKIEDHIKCTDKKQAILAFAGG